MEAIYLHDWATPDSWSELSRQAQLVKDFEIPESELEGVEILLASYTCADYSGDSFVLFRKDGRLYEVNASHCSCYGLEGQWEPEVASVVELRRRVTKGRYGLGEYGTELLQVLDALEAQEQP